VLVSRRNDDATTLDDFTVAIERMVAGLEKRSHILSAEERRRVAYHEMGHALVAASLPGVDPLHKASIIPRGVGALGYTPCNALRRIAFCWRATTSKTASLC
jgi:cell division protease FtsH